MEGADEEVEEWVDEPELIAPVPDLSDDETTPDESPSPSPSEWAELLDSLSSLEESLRSLEEADSSSSVDSSTSSDGLPCPPGMLEHEPEPALEWRPESPGSSCSWPVQDVTTATLLATLRSELLLAAGLIALFMAGTFWTSIGTRR